MAHAQQKPTAAHLDKQARERIAATIARVHLTPVDADAPNLLQQLADIFRQRAAAGWNTPLSPETALLVADALDAYAPKQPSPAYGRPGARFRIDMYASGSIVYRLDRAGEIFEIAAWAQSTLVANRAFDALVEQYPNDRFLQKRRAWVERE